MNDVSVSRFEIDGKVVYGRITWKPNDYDFIHVTLYDGTTVWSGRFSTDFANKFRDRIDLNEEEYLNEIKSFFSCKNSTFSYDFKPVPGDTNSFNLRWFKRLEDAMVVYGCIPVHQVQDPKDAGSKDSLIDILLKENEDLQDKLSLVNQQNEVIAEDFEKCKHELEKIVDIKTSLESSLYGKFVELLNAKKRRIQLLEDNLNKLQDPGDDGLILERNSEPPF